MSRATIPLSNALLNASFGRAAFPSITHLYLMLFANNATQAALNAGSMISELPLSGNYSRVTLHSTIVMSAASLGVIVNQTDIVAPVASAAWGTIGWIGLADTGGTNGTMWLYASLSSPVYIDTGQQFKINASNFVFIVD